jgi:sucrose-6-phosphate hydrolase SacC (GH32 family)
MILDSGEDLYGPHTWQEQELDSVMILDNGEDLYGPHTWQAIS